MHYTSLQLKNYRSYRDNSIELSDGVNIVVGPNASGKTNILEALLVISSGKSFRATAKDLVKHGNKTSKVLAITNHSQERSLIIKLNELGRAEKQFKINNVPHLRLTKDKIIPTVLFEPEHMRMIRGSPELRRDFLDTILASTTIGYNSTLNRYKKALAQRNKLLKTNRKLLPDDVFVWDVQLSEYGARVNQARHELTNQINEQLNQTYSAVSGVKTNIKMTYDNSNQSKDYATKLLKRHQENLVHDKNRGFTSSGPHREDISFKINSKESAHSASRGEARTLVLSLKLIELAIKEKLLEKKPIILLDDVFSELDGGRRIALTQHLKDHQTIITTTDADSIVKNFLDGHNVILTN